MLLRSIISDKNIFNINYSILQTTIYTFFDKFNTESCLNSYDKMRPFFFKIAHGPFLGVKLFVWIRFYMIYCLQVIYSDKVLISMFINVKCLIQCDSDCCFRLLSALPVKIFKIAIFSSALCCTCAQYFVDVSCF